MSHMLATKVKIKKVKKGILNQALKMFKAELEKVDQTVVFQGYVKDYYGKKLTVWQGKEVLVGIFNSGVTRGIGICIDQKGQVELVGDGYGNYGAFNSLKEKIQNKLRYSYTIQNIRLVTQSRGYTLQSQKNLGKRKQLVFVNNS